MKLILCLFLILTCSYLFAKQKDTVIIGRDTINIRGIVYKQDGKPAKNIEIGLLKPDIWELDYPRITKTDTNGCFELKGAQLYDTLRMIDARYSDVHFPNRGCRFIVIYLPTPKIIELNATDPILVTAHRKYAKTKFSFHVKNEVVFDRAAIEVYPDYPGGSEKFINFIRQKLIYPEKAINNNIEGTVEIAFTVDSNGALTDIEVIKGIGYGCDEQIVQAIKNAPKWHPGIFCGRPYTPRETVSVRFSLTDN